MRQYSVTEVVEQAVQTERLGIQFYRSMRDRFKDHKGLSVLFGELADKEAVHEKRFLELSGKVKAVEYEGWDEVALYLRAIVESEFFLGKEKALPSLDHVKTVGGAVSFALGFEKETLLYFYGIRDVMGDQGIVDAIIEEEKTHITWLSRLKADLGR